MIIYLGTQYVIVDGRVVIVDEFTGQPLLVGTRSVLTSENLAQRLTGRGFEFKLLNAVRHQEEARVVAVAGERGRITIPTNMAGRGTDIRLGDGVAGLGGLCVIATERHQSRRVDRQLFGRSARQGDPGSAQAFLSVEDELFRRHLARAFQRQVDRLVEARAVGWSKVAQAALGWAQRAAQRQAFKMRRDVLRLDDWMEEPLSFASAEMGDTPIHQHVRGPAVRRFVDAKITFS